MRCPADGSDWCWRCYANIRGREAYKGHLSYRPRTVSPVKELSMELRRVEPGKPVNQLPSEPVVDEFSGMCPDLLQFLTASSWPDGKPRALPTLMSCYEDGRWRVCLNDKANGRSVWVSGMTWTEALEALERGLNGDCLEWRKNRWAGGRK